MQKANLSPPQDPSGTLSLFPDLMLPSSHLVSLLSSTLNKLLEYLYIEKNTYAKRVTREGKDLIDRNVDELDENLRK